MFKYLIKRFRGYFSLKSCNICKSSAKLINVKASVFVFLDGVCVSLKTIYSIDKIIRCNTFHLFN